MHLCNLMALTGIHKRKRVNQANIFVTNSKTTEDHYLGKKNTSHSYSREILCCIPHLSFEKIIDKLNFTFFVHMKHLSFRTVLYLLLD